MPPGSGEGDSRPWWGTEGKGGGAGGYLASLRCRSRRAPPSRASPCRPSPRPPPSPPLFPLGANGHRSFKEFPAGGVARREAGRGGERARREAREGGTRGREDDTCWRFGFREEGEREEARI